MACLIQNTHVCKWIWCWIRGIWRKGPSRNTAFFFWSCVFHLPTARRLGPGFASFLRGTIGNVTNPRGFCSCSRTDCSLKVPRCELCDSSLVMPFIQQQQPYLQWLTLFFTFVMVQQWCRALCRRELADDNQRILKAFQNPERIDNMSAQCRNDERNNGCSNVAAI